MHVQIRSNHGKKKRTRSSSQSCLYSRKAAVVKIADVELFFPQKRLEIRMLVCCGEHVNEFEYSLWRMCARTEPDNSREYSAVYISHDSNL